MSPVGYLVEFMELCSSDFPFCLLKTKSLTAGFSHTLNAFVITGQHKVSKKKRVPVVHPHKKLAHLFLYFLLGVFCTGTVLLIKNASV